MLTRGLTSSFSSFVYDCDYDNSTTNSMDFMSLCLVINERDKQIMPVKEWRAVRLLAAGFCTSLIKCVPLVKPHNATGDGSKEKLMHAKCN